MEPQTLAYWLPVIFAFLMGLSVLLYVILDGYDLGVGIVLPKGTSGEKDQMIASIGPFWDANETWLVMGVGLLLVAFPVAHGIILTSLYLPTALMLLGLILRGVSFDFRAKVRDAKKERWDSLFFAGSVLTAFAQGFMLGNYIMGFSNTSEALAFSLLTGLCVVSGYGFIGSCWLIMKTEDELQKKAISWAKVTLWLTAVGIGLVSVATPLMNAHIFDKWFSLPSFYFFLPLPVISGFLVLWLTWFLGRLPMPKKESGHDTYCWVPFAGAFVLFLLCFLGLAYSFFPYLIPGSMTIWDAASATESLTIILVGALVVLPCIIGYTIFAYRVFWGKVRDLRYY
jgi:cytochrome d ubiquinol oxidase subunit II